MKLARLLIENTLGIRHLDLATSAPITLVCGSNGAGKSSLQESISMALRGQPLRVNPAKKDMAILVAEGAKSGAINLWLDDDRACAFTLPSAEHQPTLTETEANYLPYLLDIGRFAHATADERRKLLFQLTDCKVTPEIIGQRLLAKGAEQGKVEAIKPLLLSGFPAACKEAKSRATDAKGAWRGVTGETYGDKKADGWTPAEPEQVVTDEALAEAERTMADLETTATEALVKVATLEAQATRAADEAHKLTKLDELAELIERRQTKLSLDQKALDSWEAKWVEAKEEVEKLARYDLLHRLAYAAKMYMERYPNSSQDAMRLESVLSDYTSQHGDPRKADGSGDPELARREQEFAGYVEKHERMVANDRRDLEESMRADEEANRIRDLTRIVQLGTPEQAKAEAELQISKRDEYREILAGLRVAALQTRHRSENATKAAQHHADVRGWTLIAEQLAPDALPTELLSVALEPVNSLLLELATSAGWRITRLGADMEISADNRPHGLLSESEQWRCNALIALTIARLSGIKLVVLDRFDVLDIPSRKQLLGLLIKQSRSGQIDSAVICGTLKEAPTINVAEIQVVWMERGSIAAPIEQREAA